MPANMITQKLLRERFDYSPDTGEFTYRIGVGNKKKGDIAGCPCNGYLFITVYGKQIGMHRAIFMYVQGRWPDEVDHINHRGTDNRWSNLREVNHAENCKNRTMHKNNVSGQMGVHFDKSKGRWRARIKINSVYRHIGWYSDLSDAIAARESAEREYGFHPNHGIA